MKLTERDIEIIKFINDFGFCEMPHIERKFNVKKHRSYKILSRLIKTGLVIHQRVLHNRHGIFRLSKLGASYTELPQLARIPIAIYDHQLTIIEQHFNLMQQYPDTLWVSERCLKREKFKTGIGKYGHVADGMLIFPDGNNVAIEVELTLKGHHRLTDIMLSYGLQTTYREVWYFCSPKIATTIAQLAENLAYVKVNSLL